jgi:hypothetical protein
VLGEFRDQFRRHADIAGRLTSDRHIPPQRRAGRRVQVPVDLAAKASEPDSSVCAERTSSGELGCLAARLAASPRTCSA